jgi:hypothetical protein
MSILNLFGFRYPSVRRLMEMILLLRPSARALVIAWLQCVITLSSFLASIRATALSTLVGSRHVVRCGCECPCLLWSESDLKRSGDVMVEQSDGAIIDRSNLPVKDVINTSSKSDEGRAWVKRLSGLEIVVVFLALAWVIVFGAGLLVETRVARFFLAPLTMLESMKTTGVPDALKTLHESVGLQYIKSQENQLPPVFSDDAAAISSMLKWSAERKMICSVYDLVLCLFCYTPINVGILAFVSGAIGGTMSCHYFGLLEVAEKEKLRKDAPDRMIALQQSPAISAAQGLVSYLCIVAGLYVIVDDPFKVPTVGQYAKLAGLASALAFAVGYDRSRFVGLLGGIPAGANQLAPGDKPPTGPPVQK